jgi:surface protein
MFYNCSSVDQIDASGFDMTSVGDVKSMFLGTDMNESGTTTNYDNLLVAWEAQDLVNDLSFHGGDAQYSSTGETAKNAIIADDNWTITDGGLAS